MNVATVWGKANILDNCYLTDGKNYRKVKMTCEGEDLTLPVTPWRYTITTSQNNKVVDILDSGEALLFGNAKLKELKFSCFFPNQERHERHKYIVGDSYSPSECIDQIIKWKESKKPVRVIITDSPVNLVMGIMTFSYKEKDGTRDIWYDIAFNEYRDLNTPPANNDREIDEATGLKSRPTDSQESVINAINNQANFINGRLTNENGGIPIKMTGGIQAPYGCYDVVSNQSQAAIKGISNARDVVEMAKSVYGNFQSLSTLQSKNNISHLSVGSVTSSLKGKAFRL